MKFKLGQSLIELLIIIGIAAIILPALITGLITSRDGKAQQIQRTDATAHLREIVEAVRNVRESGWTNIATNGTFHPVLSGSQWTLASGSEDINNYTRQIVVSDVYRDANGAITQIGGTLDLSTKKIVATVSWITPLPSSVSTTLYLTRYLENTAHLETTQAEFNTGTLTGVTTSSSQGGEIVLGGGGHGAGDWCSPNLSLFSLDLPKSGVANTISAIEGRAFAGTGENASGVSFANVSIADTYPPSAAIDGTYDCCKTNDIYGETNYAYLATDNNTKEVIITNIGSTPYSEAGYFNAPGNGNGNSIFTQGSIGYMTSGDKFYTFDLSSKTGSRPQLGTVTLSSTGNSINVVGNYAYVATNSTSAELQIIDVTNPASPTIVSSVNLDSGSGKDVFVNTSGTRAYVATNVSSSQRELYILNISNKTSPSIISSYESNGMSPKGVRVVTNNKAILVGTSAEEYQVIDITNESSPSRCGGMQVDAGINAVSSVLESDGDTYSYILTGDATSEFKIIEGGPNGQYSSSGTFESTTFPNPTLHPGITTANYNRLYATVAKPDQTNVRIQVSVMDGINDSCSGVTFNFVGPDGSSNTYFETTDGSTIIGQVPSNDDAIGYENPGRCMRYKAYLETNDSSQTPVVYDVSVNYSP